jgi:hypothetical protein
MTSRAAIVAASVLGAAGPDDGNEYRSKDTATAFDGTNYVDVDTGPGFEGKAPFTLEAWVSPVAGSGDPMCIAAKTFAPGGAAGSVADGYSFQRGGDPEVARVRR